MFLPKKRAEKYITLRNDPKKTLDELLEFPTYFVIEPTADCNAMCRMCPLSHRQNKFIDDELFYKIVNQIIPYENKVKQITVQAAMMLVELKYLQSKIDRKRKIAEIYDKTLKNIVVCPKREGPYHIYYSYTIIAKRRDELKEYLNSKGIETKIQHPRS